VKTEMTEITGINGWPLMWETAFLIFALCKWWTWRRAAVGPYATARSLEYLICWPGLDAAAFLDERLVAKRPRLSEWLSAFGKTGLGSALIWGGARQFWPSHPLGAGWTGMVGIIFFLHFGLFHLVSLFWRRRGWLAEPLMRWPIVSESLGEFWGRRWNRGFHDLATRLVFAPLLPKLGTTGAALASFLFSGIVHELVITVPAGGGYGLPTTYFLLQGAGVVTQRSGWSRRHGFHRGICGWFVTVLIVAGPAFWLFPPVFVRTVICPFLKALHAL
jgi:hypothetical protein